MTEEQPKETQGSVPTETIETATVNVEALNEKLELLQAKRERFVYEVGINLEKQAIIEAGYKPVECKMVFEQNDRFWEIMLEELKFKHAQANNADNNALVEMDKVIAETSQLLTDAQDTLVKFQEELGI